MRFLLLLVVVVRIIYNFAIWYFGKSVASVCRAQVGNLRLFALRSSQCHSVALPLPVDATHFGPNPALPD